MHFAIVNNKICGDFTFNKDIDKNLSVCVFTRLGSIDGKFMDLCSTRVTTSDKVKLERNLMKIIEIQTK